MPKFKKQVGHTYYIKKGRVGSYPIIGCHGGPGGTHKSIKPLLELATDRQVVVYDQIGSGNSTHTKVENWTIDVFCENLNDLSRHLGFEEFILYGSSWGGTLILEYIKRYPHKVKALIFHSSLITSAQWVIDAKKLIKKLPKNTQEVIKACEKVGATDAKVYQDAVIEYYKKHVCRDLSIYKETKKRKAKNNEALYNYMWGPSEFCPTGTLKKYDGTSVLKKVDVPTLFLSGEFDEATPASALKFSKMVKNGQFKMIKGASHSSFKEKKAATIKIITAFLDDQNL